MKIKIFFCTHTENINRWKQSKFCWKKEGTIKSITGTSNVHTKFRILIPVTDPTENYKMKMPFGSIKYFSNWIDLVQILADSYEQSIAHVVRIIYHMHL